MRNSRPTPAIAFAAVAVVLLSLLPDRLQAQDYGKIVRIDPDFSGCAPTWP